MKLKLQVLRSRGSIFALALVLGGSVTVFLPHAAHSRQGTHATKTSVRDKFRNAASAVRKKVVVGAQNAASAINDPRSFNHPDFNKPDPYGHGTRYDAKEAAKKAAKVHPAN